VPYGLKVSEKKFMKLLLNLRRLIGNPAHVESVLCVSRLVFILKAKIGSRFQSRKKTSKRRQSMLDASGSLRIQQHNTVRDVLLAELSLCVNFFASPSTQQHAPLKQPSLM
jgi:hypothetical protein